MPKVTTEPLELPLDVGSEPVPTGERHERQRQADARHPRAQGDVDRRAHHGRQGPRGRGRGGPAQAGAHLQDPAGADREDRPDLRRGRARVPAGRLRLPARARVQLPARPGRHLRLAVADPALRPAHRRHRLRPDPPAEGRRALLRPDQGRGGQLRAPGSRPQQDLLRQPDAALPDGAAEARGPRRHVDARHGPRDADRQGPARPDRRPAAHRQDDAAAEDRQRDRQEPSGGRAHRAAHRRAARKRSPTCSAR